MDLVEAGKIQIATIHNVNGACLYRDIVQYIDFVDLAVSNKDQGRYASAQIEQRMEFHSPFAFAELRPGKQR